MAAFGLGSVVASPRRAKAQDPAAASEEFVAEARARFREGTERFQAEAWSDALSAFRESHALVASPNTSLMVARCLRALDRAAEALETYARAIREAKGLAKYEAAGDAAKNEMAALKASLVAITVQLQDAPAGTRVFIGGEAWPLVRAEARAFVPPGEVAVVVVPPDGGEEVRREIVAERGRDVILALALPRAGRRPAPPSDRVSAPSEEEEQRDPLGWTLSAALVSAGVGAIGTGIFIGFGLRGEARYRDLERTCAPRCGASFDDAVAAGERDGHIANVGLTVGALGTAAAVVFGTIFVTRDTSVAVGPQAARLRVRF
ncbi:MAG: hypothetical protein AAF928_01100 [Myxococcota bacterium]